MKANLVRLHVCVLMLGMLVWGPSLAWSQAVVSGTITGLVTDATGAAVVAGATVRATNVLTNVTTQVATNDAGLYRIVGILPGTYTVAVEKEGFKTARVGNVVVGVDTVVRADATLQIGAVVESITITGAAPMLKTEKGDVSHTIEAQQIARLPLPGRNITWLGQLAPGATITGDQLGGWVENAGDERRVNTNGRGSGDAYRQLDGVDNNETIQGLSLIVPTQFSVSEMKLTTSSYDAEFGQVSGVVVQIATKSGTNEFHGAAFEYYRSSGLFARNPFSEPKRPSPYVWHQFGGGAGGPIVKDKVFFFGDYQGMRSRSGGAYWGTVPTQDFRDGNFAKYSGTYTIFDPATGNADGTGRSAFPDNKIPASRISAPARTLLSRLPMPTGTGDEMNYRKVASAALDQNQMSSRVDYNMSGESRLFARYSLFRASYDIPGVFGDLGGDPMGGGVIPGNHGSETHSGVINYTRVISPTWLADVRFAIAREEMFAVPKDVAKRTADEVGIPGINTGTQFTNGLPAFNIGGNVGGFWFGGSFPFFENVTNINVSTNWTKMTRSHSFKWGVDIKKAFEGRSDGNGRGSFFFTRNITADSLTANSGLGMATFLLGLPDSYSRRVTLDIITEKQWRNGAYFQDNWSITRNLTLNLGVRWEYFSPIFSGKDGGIFNLDLGTGDILLGNIYNKYAGVEPIYDEFAPRVGLAYRMKNNTVIRAGYGRGYSLAIYGANFGNQAATWPVQQNQSVSPANIYSPVFRLEDGPPAPAAIPEYPSSGRIPLPNGVTVYQRGVGPYPHTYVDSWNLTIQRQLRPDLTVEAGYVGNVGRKEWAHQNINAAKPGPGDLNPRRRFYEQFGWTQPIYLSRGLTRSSYNSLQAKVEKSFSSGFSVTSMFTWAKMMDEDQSNAFDIHSNRGPDNRALSSATSWVWELPIGPGRAIGKGMKGVPGHFIGGWNLSGILYLESGTYFNPWVDASSLNSDCCSLRPDRIGSGELSNPTRQMWFDATAFVAPTKLYTYGNSGRNILEGPGIASTDLSLAKTVSVTERVKLELRLDAFNAFNRTNLGAPVTTISSPRVGQITGIQGGTTMRRAQFGAQLTF